MRPALSITMPEAKTDLSATRNAPMAYEENHLGNIVTGVLLSGLVGGGLGLGACVFVFEGTLLFTGETVLIGAVTCSTMSYFLGEGFLEWLKENWWWFW